MHKSIAKITRTYLGRGEASHRVFTATLEVDYGNGEHQSIGGYNLGGNTGYAGAFIRATLNAAGVDAWEDLVGKTIFVLTEHDPAGPGPNRILGIEHLPTEPGGRFVFSELSPFDVKFAPFNFSLVDECDGMPFATGVDGAPVVFDPRTDPHVLLSGETGAGKSVVAQDLLYGFLAHGADAYVIDLMTGGADYAFAKGHLKALACTQIEAVRALEAVFEEVRRRWSVIAGHGAGSYRDLPPEVRPRPILVLVDEVTPLPCLPPMPPGTGSPEGATVITALIGRLVREARSAGVTVLLTAQDVRGWISVKANTAHMLLGAASHEARMRALSGPDDAPAVTGDVPKGRGVWESSETGAVVVQAWFASQDLLEAELLKRRPPLTDGERLDLSGLDAPDNDVKGAGA